MELSVPGFRGERKDLIDQQREYSAQALAVPVSMLSRLHDHSLSDHLISQPIYTSRN
jgi:hypothetical protein